MSYPQGPQYGGYPQQPGGYPQQPPSGAFPQQGYPQQPGGYPQPPRRNNNGPVIALAAVAAAAIIALVVVLIVSGGDDDDSSASGSNSGSSSEAKPPGAPDVTIPGPNSRPTGGSRPTSGGGSGSGSSGGGAGSAQELAEQAVSIIESRSLSRIDSLACSSSAASELRRELTRLPPGATAQLGDVTESSSTARARITLDISGQTQTITLEMRKSGSNWCASGI